MPKQIEDVVSDRRNRFAFATYETETLIQAEADERDQIRALPAELITVIARQMSSLVSKIQSGKSNGSFALERLRGTNRSR